MPNKCSCKTVKNSQCSFNARASEEYCGHHEACNRPIGPKKKPSAVKKPTQFSPPYNAMCEGFWDEKNNPQHMVSKINWPSKNMFLSHVKDVEAGLIYQKMKKPENRAYGLYDTFAMYVAYTGEHSISEIDGTVLGSHMFRINDSSGMIVCWPELYADHYIGKYNRDRRSLVCNHI